MVPNLWGGIVGRPGFMKTPALQEALRFLKRLVDEAKEQYDRECCGQETLRLVHKAKADAAKGELKKGAKRRT